MKISYYILEFEKNKNILSLFFSDLEEEFIHWRPANNKWSVLEILCHLRDEEKEDFRARIRSILKDPKKDLVKFDPEDWVIKRNYSQQDFNLVLDNFINERNDSVQWLKSLDNPNWHNAYNHSRLGPMSAEYFLQNWLAHDYLHIRQLTRYKFQFLQNKVQSDLNYAGKW